MTSASAHGLQTIDLASGAVLDAWYPDPALSAEPRVIDGLSGGQDPIRGVRVEPVTTVIADLDEPPVDVADVYLRLHLLSHRLVAPHGLSLDGIFGVLTNVAWTSLGPVAVDRLARRAAEHPRQRWSSRACTASTSSRA